MRVVFYIFTFLLIVLFFTSLSLSQQDLQIAEAITLRGHTKPVFTLAFSPDGKFLASGSYDKTVRIWNIETGILLQTLTGHTGSVFSVVYNSGGEVLASGGKDGAVIIWTTEKWKQSRTFTTNSPVLSLAFHPNNTQVAAGCENGKLILFDVNSGKTIYKMDGHSDWISSIDFSSDGSYLASGSYDRTIKIWTPLLGKRMTTLPEGNVSVNAIAFGPEGSDLVAGSSDKTIKLWEIPSGKEIRTFEQGSGEILSVSFSTDGKYLACAMSDGMIGVWEVASGKKVNVFASESEIVNTAVFSPDDKFIASAGGENIIRLWKFGEKPNQPPVITILSSDTVTDNNKFILSANVTDDKQVTKILIKHNEFPIANEDLNNKNENFQTRGFQVVPSQQINMNYGSKININREITLKEGENKIDIEASDGELSASKSRSISYEIPFWTKQKRWAVIVGISKYQDSRIPSLQYADDDAMEYYNFLKSPQGGGFGEENIKLLINENATIQNVRDALSVFLSHTIEEDIVIIYFSGHGDSEPYNKNNMYLLTYDTDRDRLPSTAYPMWEIETTFDRHINAEKIVFLADACHSGATSGMIAARTRNLDNQNLINKYLLELAKSKPGRVIFTSSRASEASNESPMWGKGHGCFTYFLLEGLKGAADRDRNGIITLGESIDYTNEKVIRETNSNQHPSTAGLFDNKLPMSVIR